MPGEDELVGWLRKAFGPRSAELIGDDAALLPESEPWAVTTDCQIAGVHFPEGADPRLIARRLLAVNLSDLAAMGASPAYAFLALAVPEGFDHRRFFRALREGCRKVSLTLAGGDLSSHSRITAVLTLLGRRQPGGRWLRRGDARPGETLWVGGKLGEAAAGLALLRAGAGLEGRVVNLPPLPGARPAVLPVARRAVRRQLQPRPQLALGAWLSGTDRGAAIDISDGLARDLHRLCRASRVGAEVDFSALPRSRGLAGLLELLDLPVGETLLGGGEDYVLLFTLPPEIEPPARFGCRKIGKILRRREIHLLAKGRRAPLPPLGWDHLLL